MAWCRVTDADAKTGGEKSKKPVFVPTKYTAAWVHPDGEEEPYARCQLERLQVD